MVNKANKKSTGNKSTCKGKPNDSAKLEREILYDTTKRSVLKIAGHLIRSESHGPEPEHVPELSRAKLADIMGVARVQVSRMLSGRTRPTLDTVEKLRVALKVKTMGDAIEWLEMVRWMYKGR